MPGGDDEYSCRGGSLRLMLPVPEPCASSGDGLRIGLIDCGGVMTAMPAAPELPVDCAPATDGSAATAIAASKIGARHRRRNGIASAIIVGMAPNTRRETDGDGRESRKEHMPAEKPGI